MDPLAFAAVLLVLALLPVQKTIGSGALAKLAPVDLATIAAATLAILAFAIPARRREIAARLAELRIPRLLVLGGSVFFAFACASFPRAEETRTAGVEMLAHAANVVLFALVALCVSSVDRLRLALAAWRWGSALALAGGIAGILLLLHGSFDSPLTDRPLLTSTLQRSGQFAGYLLASIPVIWLGTRGVLRAALVAAASACLVATASRSGFVLGVLLVAFLAIGRIHRARRAAIAVGCAALVAALFAAALRTDAFPFSAKRALSIASPRAFSLDRLSPSRSYQWSAWQAAAEEATILGVGPADFQHRVTSYEPAAFRPHELHNTFLGVWAETGLPGVLGLALVAGAFLQMGLQSIRDARDPFLRDASFALLLSILAVGAFGLFAYGLRMRFLWAACGLLLATWNLVRCSARSSS